MSAKRILNRLAHTARVSLAILTAVLFSLGGTLANAAPPDKKTQGKDSKSPVKHVIVIVGENRSFDHVFATYKPKHGETVDNLLSKHIINEDGTHGSKYWLATQYSADITGATEFQLSPTNKTPYGIHPAPLTGGPTDVCKNNGICTLADAEASENGLPDAAYYGFLTSGGTGVPGRVPDSRVTGVHSTAPYSSLPGGPFQLSNSKTSDTFNWDSYASSPVHRFYQMWQQADCNVAYASKSNPSGCKSDLFAWSELTVGSNENGNPQPANFSTDYSPTATTPGDGPTPIGCYTISP